MIFLVWAVVAALFGLSFVWVVKASPGWFEKAKLPPLLSVSIPTAIATTFAALAGLLFFIAALFAVIGLGSLVNYFVFM